MVEWYCEKCPENKNKDCGEWTENNSELFKNVKQIHSKHPGWQQGKPKPSAKEELEKQANKTMENIVDEFTYQYTNNNKEFIEELNEKFRFHSENAGRETTKQILNYKIRTLRPLTYFQSDNTKMILVFLPTKKTTVKGRDENTTVETEWINSAYFVISKTDSSGVSIREILPFDDHSLAEKFRIKVLPEWNDIRWDIRDCKNWISENILSNPKELYELLDKTTRVYLEYAESEYVKFNLWNIGTYFYELFDAFPYNDFTGTKRSGKTKSLEFQKHVCYNSVMTPDMTGSSLFRIIEGMGATILLDETEEFKNKRNDQAQALRNLLMQSFLRDQHAIRNDTTKDRNFTPTQYNIYSPKSLAHINSFDDVLEDRCIKQINRRALDDKIKNTWVSNQDSSFQIIRNKCYRLFLDYADQIYNLQKEAKSKLCVSGRELQLWIPIMTLALFFEKFGISGLVDNVAFSVSESFENRQLSDEEESKDLKVLSYLDDYGVSIAVNDTYLKDNPKGWIAIALLYSHFRGMMDDYEINPEYFTRHVLTQTLRRLGFKQTKKQAGISWLITRQEVDEIRKRMGFVEYKDDSLDTFSTSPIIDKKSSEGSVCAVLGVKSEKTNENEKFRNEVKSSESQQGSRHESEQNEVNEHSEPQTGHTDSNEIESKSELLNNLELSELQKSSETPKSSEKGD
ncbi:MAG: hypothetical protein IIC67_02715 [Thaumarchaeota archaeon]|nr:hypothetical protein [Nitrososphaerota archaeon]